MNKTVYKKRARPVSRNKEGRLLISGVPMTDILLAGLGNQMWAGEVSQALKEKDMHRAVHAAMLYGATLPYTEQGVELVREEEAAWLRSYRKPQKTKGQGK